MVMTSFVTSALYSFYSVGNMVTGFITGYLFETYSAMWVLHITLIASLAQLVFFVLAFVTVKVMKREDISITKIVEERESLRS